MTRTGSLLIASTLTTIAAIYYVHGDQDNTAINHALPTLIALLPIVFVDRMKSIVARSATYAFTFTTIGFTLLVYLAWITDLGHFASGSSTSALVFIFLPLLSLKAGLLVSILAMVITIIREFRKRNPNQAL